MKQKNPALTGRLYNDCFSMSIVPLFLVEVQIMLVTGEEDVGLSRTTSKHVTARKKSDVDHSRSPLP